MAVSLRVQGVTLTTASDTEVLSAAIDILAEEAQFAAEKINCHEADCNPVTRSHCVAYINAVQASAP